jgi:hypothetical protein
MDPPRELSEKEKACVKFQLDLYYKKKPVKCRSDSPLRASGKAGKVIPKPTSASGSY